MMDYIAGLVQRGLISPDVAQKIAYVYSNRPGMPQVTGPETAPKGGARNYMGSSGKKVVAPDYSKSANQNDPRQQFIDEYDALVRQKAADANREGFQVVPKDTEK